MLGLRSASTATAGAVSIIVVFSCAVRVATLLEMVPSIRSAYDTSPHPGWALATWLVAVGAVAGVIGRAVYRSGLPTGWEVIIDCAVAGALLAVGAWTVPLDQRIGTWTGFQPGYALSVVISAAACQSLRAWGVGLGAVLIGKVVFVWSVTGWGNASTVAGDFLTVVVLGIISVALGRYILGLATEADRARRMDAEAEVRRARAVFHNGVAVLGLLAEEDLDPATRTAIRDQARLEVHRARTYLSGENGSAAPDRPPSGVVPLPEIVRRAAGAFPDLAPQLMLDLAGSARVTAAEAEPLSAALVSLLLNVRQHARASATVLHVDEVDGEWTITVHDDGCGFDTASVSPRVGLGQVVYAALDELGIVAGIDSMPGFGTTVTLTGRSIA